MNKVIDPQSKQDENDILIGSIIRLINGDYYILSLVYPDKYCLVSLTDGNRWNNPVAHKNISLGPMSGLTIADIIKDFGLNPDIKVFTSCEITIKEIKA